MFLLVDQPFVSAPLVRMLVEEHARTLAPIVAPLIDEQRGNPVLFDRMTFADFAALEGDVGARPLFARYRTPNTSCASSRHCAAAARSWR